MDDSLKNVVTTQEAAVILGISDSGVRHNIRKNKYNNSKYRSSGKTYIFDKKYILSLSKNKKN